MVIVVKTFEFTYQSYNPLSPFSAGRFTGIVPCWEEWVIWQSGLEAKLPILPSS